MTDTPLVRLLVGADSPFGIGTGTVVLDSPANRNALSARLRRELLAALDTAAADERVRVLVLTHAGPVFCAGMDLKESRDAAADDQGVGELPAILRRLWEFPTPVIARLAGTARAGGVGLVAATDLAVAADTVTFAFTEVRIGVVPAVISATVLPRLHPRAAQELLLTGNPFPAARAAAIGLLTAAVPPADLDAVVAAYVTALLRGAPGAQAATKELLRRPYRTDLGDLDELQRWSADHFAGPEGQEGIAAFLEKRPPAWVIEPHPASEEDDRA